MKVKRLKKINNNVTNEEYNKYESESDTSYYYIYYSFKSDIDGNYSLFTNSSLYGESREIYKSKDKSEVVKISQIVNNSIRLLAGYYDNNISHKNECFPSTIVRDNT
jgi:hypothetical protein